ncbi:hypothetical protein [Streptomyces sp. enrichment culture]|uniref:hypothetical protein n=1 Tax=Streptomyces sp. enrichment culture TaxID=1795815 RepID=UPI003F57BB96
MPAADRAPDARLDPYGLDLEMSLLLSSTAPPQWRAAVEEAAHLLKERHRGERYRGQWAELPTLALLLFARAHASDRVPRDVTAEELVQELDAPSGGKNRVAEEIRRALNATGQGHDARQPGWEPPLLLIFGPVSDRYGGPTPWSDEWDPVPPGLSPLDRAAEQLVGYLSAYSPGRRDSPSLVPAVDDGPLYIEADAVLMASRSSLVPPSCGCSCRRPRPRRLTVDGPVVVVDCEECDTRRRHEQLDPAHVRLAVARALGVAPSVQGAYSIPGELYIPLAEMARGADPYQFNWFLAGRSGKSLGAAGPTKP